MIYEAVWHSCVTLDVCCGDVMFIIAMAMGRSLLLAQRKKNRRGWQHLKAKMWCFTWLIIQWCNKDFNSEIKHSQSRLENVKLVWISGANSEKDSNIFWLFAHKLSTLFTLYLWSSFWAKATQSASQTYIQRYYETQKGPTETLKPTQRTPLPDHKLLCIWPKLFVS